MNTNSTLAKMSLVNKKTRLLAAAVVALATGACGITKSGFSTDPLAGQNQYKEMHAKGVPQLGAPNQVESIEVKPEGYDQALAAYNKGVAQLTAQKSAMVVNDAAGETSPAAEGAVNEKLVSVPVVEITIPEVPLPETQVLTFVENEAVVYRFKIEGAKAKASMKNLIKGMVFGPSDDQSKEVYDLKWSPKAGDAGEAGAKLSSMKLDAGASEHLLIVSVVKDGNRPVIEKVSLLANAMNPGEQMAVKVLFSDSSNTAAESFSASVKPENKSSPAVKQAVELTRVNAITKQSDGVYLAELLVDTKGVKFGAKDSHLRFFVSVGQGERVSAAIPMSIKLNKKAGSKKAGGKK